MRNNFRRRFLKNTLGIVALGSVSFNVPFVNGKSSPKVVVIGGGFGGATVSKYIKIWNPDIDVTIIEKNINYISCPISNRIFSGKVDLNYLTHNYETLSKKYSIKIINDTVNSIDTKNKKVTFSHKSLNYDILVVSPGVEFNYENIPEFKKNKQSVPLHAWKAGRQTIELKKQLVDMRNGGVFSIIIPQAPYRCPPGPYERACQVAHYLKNNKPKSKIVIYDANEKIQSKGALFKKYWSDLYPGMIDYYPMMPLRDFNPSTNSLIFDFDEMTHDVVNYIPDQRAPQFIREVAAKAGSNWCEIDFRSYQSIYDDNIYIVGDSILPSPKMPKSGHMANSQAKVCASAIVRNLSGKDANQNPIVNNTCYSFVSDDEVIHVAAVYKYNEKKKLMEVIPESTGVSNKASKIEGIYAEGWASGIWHDMFS